MEKTEIKVVDLYKKCSIVQDESRDDAMDVENSSDQRIYTKKVLNVPICDVHTDAEYEKNLKCSFDLPISYVKHFKKIGDEIDVSLDYIVDASDKQWVAGRIRSEPGKDVSKLFTYEAFETIINILEKYTAFSKDPIPLINAEKLIREQLSWNSQQFINIIGDVYKYWLKKREQVGKPMCRRYWPQSASSDLNPHQVFRTRDKERYRLRRQQKRNDVDAFRKMQQLRREFNKARALSELIQERELLCQADFDIQRELFEQRLYDLKLSDESATPKSPSSKKPRKEVQFRHTLKFEYINIDEVDELDFDTGKSAPYNKLINLASSSDDESDDGQPPHKQQRMNGSVTGSVISKKNESGHSRHKNQYSNGAGSEQTLNAEMKKSTIALSSAAAVSAIEETRKKLASGGEAPKRKKKEQNRLVLYTVANGVTVEVGSGQSAIPSGSSGVVATIAEASSAPVGTTVGEGGEVVDELDLEPKLIHPDLDGPVTLCQPLWPSFMASLPTRDTVPTSTQRNLTNYIRDLEFKRDSNDQVILPDKYRSRCRVGRGGRIVMDRIPVYPVSPIDEPDYWSIEDPPAVTPDNKPVGNLKYVYPTTLKVKQQLDLSAAISAVGSGLPVTKAERISLGSVTGSVAPLANVNRVVSTSPTDSLFAGGKPLSATQQPQSAAQSPSAPTKMPTRPLSEIPLSNRKLRSYNVKIKANNQMLTTAAGPTAVPGSVPLQKQLPTDLPSFMPPARLVLTNQSKQKLNEIYGESDSEDERIVIPKALRGYPELEYRSAITKSSLAAAAAAVAANGSAPAIGSASLENHNPGSKHNVKYNVYV